MMLTPPSLFQLPGFCEGSSSVLGVQPHVDCSSFLGHKAVYRMGFAMAAFFCLFAALMVCVRSSKDPRAALQNGCVWSLCSPGRWGGGGQDPPPPFPRGAHRASSLLPQLLVLQVPGAGGDHGGGLLHPRRRLHLR